MAGRKHHFIQRLILRGFSYDYPSDPCHIWVYRSDGKIFSPATEGYGAEKDFYGDPDTTGLDDRITDLENDRFNNFLQSLRSRPDQNVDADEASALAIHVFFRSKHFRAMMTAGMEPLMARCREMLRSEETLEKLIASGLKTHPEILSRFDLSGLPPVMRSEITEHLAPLFRSLAKTVIAAKRNQIDLLLDETVKRISDFVAKAHRDSLQQRLNDFSGTRGSQLRLLKWQTLTTTDCFILGDSVVFCELANNTFKPLTEPNDALANVWLPISSSRILVGSSNDCPIQADAERINRGAASCSFDAFCAHDGPEAHESLISLIRTATFSLDDAALDRIASECISKASD